MDFPYEIITPTARDNSFFKLQRLQFGKSDKLQLTRVYNISCNYYFQKYRLCTKKGKWSNVSAWNDPIQREKIINKTNGSPESIRQHIRLYYGCVNQFRADVAVYVYQKFKATSVLDFSAGWGNRCLAAMSQNIDYVGIDSNKKLKTPYKQMINNFKKYSTSTVEIIYDRSENVDFSAMPAYDLIFTSPPYFTLEKYENMYDYKNNEEFLKVFFIPVVRNSWKHLKKNGTMALNMPVEMYDALKPYLGRAKTICMPIHNRFYKDNDKICEYIYYWTKS